MYVPSAQTSDVDCPLLHILLPPSRKVGDKIRVQIFYSTTKDCTAVQWLEKELVGCSVGDLLYADAIRT